jgi:hypothetical protein
MATCGYSSRMISELDHITYFNVFSFPSCAFQVIYTIKIKLSTLHELIPYF